MGETFIHDGIEWKVGDEIIITDSLLIGSGSRILNWDHLIGQKFTIDAIDTGFTDSIGAIGFRVEWGGRFLWVKPGVNVKLVAPRLIISPAWESRKRKLDL